MPSVTGVLKYLVRKDHNTESEEIKTERLLSQVFFQGLDGFLTKAKGTMARVKGCQGVSLKPEKTNLGL